MQQTEARRVFEAAGDRYKKYGESKSLGIGTFNIKQQRANYQGAWTLP